MTQKMRDKAVNTRPSTIQSDSECYKTQEILTDVFLCFFYFFGRYLFDLDSILPR